VERCNCEEGRGLFLVVGDEGTETSGDEGHVDDKDEEEEIEEIVIVSNCFSIGEMSGDVVMEFILWGRRIS
jgi:hypothetical protein